MFIFMNPTGKNISSAKNWRGLRAPWLGTKNIWEIFYKLRILSESTFQKTQKLRPENWSEKFCSEIYREIAKRRTYITNLAKCTQKDAKPLKNYVFKNHLDIMKEEILLTNPKRIITFGNQVSSILLAKPIRVGDYKGKQKEILEISGKTFNVYPVYYPVGQGRRNMGLAIKRISSCSK
jgi:hypothetical protein